MGVRDSSLHLHLISFFNFNLDSSIAAEVNIEAERL